MTSSILVGDCRETLKTLPDRSVHCVITSPPYWNLRSYKGETGMIGMEKTFAEHLANLIVVFHQVHRVLRDDGTLWLNYGDSYQDGQLMMMPSELARVMKGYGWILRSEIIWAKPNSMPEPAKNRPSTAHEKIFLFTKHKGDYYYDHVAVRKKAKTDKWPGIGKQHATERDRNESQEAMQVNPTSNLKNVWYMPTQPTPYKHFAVFPTHLVEPCILAGTSEHGVCAATGKPYERLSKKGKVTEVRHNYKNHVGDHKDRNDINRVMKSYEYLTTGWQASCGAPYTRISKAEYKTHDNWYGDKQDVRNSRGKAGKAYKEITDIKTEGWQPSCECKGEIAPAVVLDPFGGSGTVSIVAERLGRDSIICEISPEYAELARQRIESESPPLFPTKLEIINYDI